MLGRQDLGPGPRCPHHVAVGLAVLAPQHAAGAVERAVAGGVRHAGRLGLDDELEIAADAARVTPVAARIGAELVLAEEEGEAHLGPLDRAELEPAGRIPLTRIVPAVAAGRGARTRAGVEHVPDERLARVRVLALEGDAETVAPGGHDPFRTGGRQRCDDRLHDLLRAVRGGHGDRRPVLGPDDGTALGDDLDRAHEAVVLRHLGVEQVGQRDGDGRAHVGPGGIEEALDLGVRFAQVDPEVAAAHGDGGADGDVEVAAAVIVEDALALVGAVLPVRDDGPGLPLRRIEDEPGRLLDGRGAKLLDER